MNDDDLATRVNEVLEADPGEFNDRVAADAEVIEDELAAGTFDNPQAIVGLEYEFYAVDEETCALERVPRRLLEFIGFEKELGLHNAEMTTSPQPLNAWGLTAQTAEVKGRLETALDCTRAEGMRLVSDGLWTIPPEGETATDYLTGSIEDDGVRIASNMSDSVRYHAMANTDRAKGLAGMVIDAPNVTVSADTVLLESLITSIQPHYQVPQAEDLPEQFRYALRIAGPLLALGVNSPFFPPDLYDEGATGEEILVGAWMEHRISVFETVLNAAHGTKGKVRFPRDVETTEEAVWRIVADETLVPMPVEQKGRFDDRFANFRLKHGTYWRWVRPVFGGPTRSNANARIEFRPIPAQPTVEDSMAFQAAFAGLMESLVRSGHPVADLDWAVAHDNFYAAMRHGLDARLQWITADGEETDRTDAIYDDLLAHARDGLVHRGLSPERADRELRPLRLRVRDRITPARWQHRRVGRLVEAGTPIDEAIQAAKREYLHRQRETLLDGCFADWVDDQ